jgi:hypothetical protein
MNSLRSVLAVLTVFMCASNAAAYLSTSSGDLISPAVIDFSQFTSQQSVGSGVQVGQLVGEDVFLTAVGDARVGPMNHGLGANGQWSRDGALSNDLLLGTFTFKFNNGPVRGAGGLVNYCPDCAAPSVLIEALDNSGNVLEGYDLVVSAPISTPNANNAGAFRGIVRPSNDIHALRLSYAFVVIDDLAFTRVPEPTALGLALVGGVASCFVLGRRRSRLAGK